MKKAATTFLFVFIISVSLFAQSTKDSATKYLVSIKGDTIRFSKNEITFFRVEIESEFPGGTAAWVKYLNENLQYPNKAVRKNIQGTVVLQFIVCTDGSICDLEAISGPDILKEAALKAFKNTPNWIPAVQDGRKVKSYKKQPITFKIQ